MVMCLCVGLFMYDSLFILLSLFVCGCFSSHFNMSSNGSVVVYSLVDLRGIVQL